MLFQIITFFLLLTRIVSQNNYPIVGILAMPTKEQGKMSFLPASYVKFVESSGARVIPIPYTTPKEELHYLLDRINGFLFPGGDYHLNLNRTEYYLAEEFIFNYALDAKKRGDHFTIWAECMGFEALINIVESVESFKNVLCLDVKCYEKAMNLEFTSSLQDSRIFSNLDSQMIDLYKQEDVLFNWHTAGMLLEDFLDSERLMEFFNVIAYNKWTNPDGNDRTFVSVIEAIDYPIYGVQFHPEKQFEWKVGEEGIIHTKKGRELNLYFGQFFVDELRKSTHSFKSLEEEQKYLIFNYNPTYTSPQECYYKNYEQTYFFNQ